MKTQHDYASKAWLRRPERPRRWHILAMLAALLLLAVTADPNDCDGKRCTSFDTAAQSR
ncbi:hypothetical protein UFOVP761_11 [uncultured Caudovirales phage]|uniref:Uncharacterized protein n=1 Tax=uncultured Caudovirales phage TaxID=2100421 RepID=A0A6J5NX35_9CAUD|nr:hypothetical protein UFOVP761_11 [uncultured Caudovirales phage]